MSESRHSEIRLSLTEGTADKEYQAWLEQVDGHFHVDFAYGRRGSALKTGRKTASPLPLEEAAAALARLVRSKEAKGYTRDASGAAYRATDLAGRVSGHAVQLLNPIEEADLEALLVSTQHVTQEKFDGCRLLVEKGPEGVRGVNKLGLYVGCAVAVAEAVAALPVRSCVLDGEAVGARGRRRGRARTAVQGTTGAAVGVAAGRGRSGGGGGDDRLLRGHQAGVARGGAGTRWRGDRDQGLECRALGRATKLGRTRAQVQALRHGHGARDRPQRHKAFGVARIAECERVDGCGG